MCWARFAHCGFVPTTDFTYRPLKENPSSGRAGFDRCLGLLSEYIFKRSRSASVRLQASADQAPPIVLHRSPVIPGIETGKAEHKRCGHKDDTNERIGRNV